MKKRGIILCFIASLHLFGQLGYNFSATTGTYSPLTGATTIHASGVDDVISGWIPIGFNFTYNCQTYSQVKVSSNGWLTFNDLTSSYATNNLSNTVGNIIAPLWDDLQVSSTGVVRYNITGTAPNRVFTVEWFQMEWNYLANADVISFQVKLYETSNRIDFIYQQGPGAVNSGSASIGINGNTSGDFYSLDGTGPNPNASKVVETTTLSTKPANGQIYRWDPINCSGAPSGGTASASPSYLSNCTTPSTLNATGHSIGCGISYQWQYQQGASWVNIPGATTVPYTIASPSLGNYRLAVTCINSGLTSYSTPVSINSGFNVLSYSFTAVSGSYTTLTSPTNIHPSNTDEAISGWIPIGFTFYYNCIPYTQIKVSTNGWLTFNDLTSAYLTNALATTVGNIIAPLWDDLKTASDGFVRYQLTGTAPNRVLTIEWYHMLWNYGATTWGINFQVKLYETTNVIEFIYERNGNATQYLNSPSASIGINGGSAGDFYSLNNTSGSPTASKTTETTTLNSKPATGQIYRWTPINCSGMPATPTINASSTNLTCPRNPVTLSATGISGGCGIQYAWQYSEDGVNWSDLSGCNFSIPITVYPEHQPSYYRLRTTCTNSGQSSYSNAVMININGSLPANDEPCNATLLPVNSFCSFITSSNLCASASQVLQPGIPAPGCGNYQGGDVWFKVTVPPSGRLILDMDAAGGPTDMDMAIYRSTTNNCNNINQLIECDDLQSVNGVMPMICRAGTSCLITGDCEQNGTLTPGETIYVRVWEYGNDLMGPFEICAYDPGTPPPASTCSNAYTITSIPFNMQGLTTCCGINDYNNTVGCLSNYQNGEDFLFVYTPTSTQTVDIVLSGTLSYTGVFVTDRCPNAPGVVCVASATSSSGNPSICGVTLNAGTTYYIMVDTYPSPNCTNFNISIRPAIAPTCNLNYTVSTIAYNPDPFTGNLISLPIDDRFSSSYIPIGFPFCFDGIQFTQLLVSSNCYVIFDPISCATNLPNGNATPGGYSSWDSDSPIPNTTNAPRNAILFPWQDTDPSSGGSIYYQILGTAPNRRFVLSFVNIPLFGTSCSGYTFTGQLKLFETTNNIEIHLQNKQACTGWNEGMAIMGIHNYNGSIARFPAGYNYTVWNATNQAWRLTCNCTGCIVLPVEFLSFNGKVEKPGINRLYWQTATERNSDYFVVQRLINGDQFKDLGKVPAAGNSSTPQSYDFIDEDAPIGYAYYRLKQVDCNGEEFYSSTIMVGSQNERVQLTNVYPNPVENELFIVVQSDGTPFDLYLVDQQGHQMIMDKVTSYHGQLKLKYDVSNLSAGNYTLQAISDKGGLLFSHSFIKTK
ncbi:MAG: T9SS type A sorting domain-containing protein [Bacteroidales bacterium]|nr:T9SS type A sorting domain-containing protein [Bacteroidales bacterium]